MRVAHVCSFFWVGFFFSLLRSLSLCCCAWMMNDNSRREGMAPIDPVNSTNPINPINPTNPTNQSARPNTTRREQKERGEEINGGEVRAGLKGEQPKPQGSTPQPKFFFFFWLFFCDFLFVFFFFFLLGVSCAVVSFCPTNAVVCAVCARAKKHTQKPVDAFLLSLCLVAALPPFPRQLSLLQCDLRLLGKSPKIN